MAARSHHLLLPPSKPFHTPTAAQHQSARNGGSMVMMTAAAITAGNVMAIATIASAARWLLSVEAVRTYHPQSSAAWLMMAGIRTASIGDPTSDSLSGPNISHDARMSHATSGPLL